MADRSIRIRVGASLDANTAAVFRPLIESAQKARTAIDGAMNSAGKSTRRLGTEAKSSASKADKAFADLERQVKGLPSPLDKAGGAARQFGKDAATSFAAARDGFWKLAKEADQSSRQIERAEARAHNARARYLRSSIGGGARVGLRVARGAIGMGTRFAGEVLGGLGVHADLGQGIAQNVELESRAAQLSNAGYMPTDETGRNVNRVNKEDLMAQARSVGMETAFDPNAALQGLEAFVGKTGDLALGRDILKDMAVLSKATGTELEHMVDAAGDAANQLGDMPGKGEVLVEIMRGIAGQGKLGAVEIKDMAKQMAKVAAAASQFEGSAKDNIILMGAFAQESRQRGGSASATQAATGVGSFINTFSKNARLNAFAGFGVQVQGNGGLRNAQAIVTDSLNAAMKHGGPNSFSRNMGQMFMDAQARRTVRGFETVYRRAYDAKSGTDQDKMAAGTAAVTAEFERLKSVTMSQTEIQESFDRAMSTTESQVQIFNNQMGAAAAQIQEQVTPALIELAQALPGIAHDIGVFLSAIPGFSDIIAQAKSREAAKKQLHGVQVTSLAMHALGDARHTEQIYDPATGTWRASGTTIDSRLPGAVNEQVSETQRALDAAKAEESKRRGDIARERGGTLAYNDKSLGEFAMGGDQAAQGVLESEQHVKELTQQLEEQKRLQGELLDAIRGGVLRVEVTNPQDLARKPRPAADMSGRAPAESPTDSE